MLKVLRKLQVIKILIVFGCVLNISNYCMELVDLYTNEDTSSIAIEESENSEQKEKEGKEKEDVNEKDKISQSYDSKASALTDANNLRYPDNFTHNVSVYLEQNTPPPEYS